MSKKNRLILGCVMGILFLLSVILFFYPRHNYEISFVKNVEVKNGIAEPGEFYYGINVNRKGTYDLFVDWYDNEDAAFVSGVSLIDGSGKEVWSTTAARLYLETYSKKLEKGRYKIKIEVLTSPEAQNRYARLRGQGELDPHDPDVIRLFKDCSVAMKYSFKIRENQYMFYLVAMISLMLIGALIMVIIVNAARTGDPDREKYDERQLIYQGKAYKYAFYTLLIYSGLILAAFIAGDAAGTYKLPIDNSILILVGIMLSVLVFAIYSILKDAYFRMNENKKFLLGVFWVLAAVNLGLGIFHVINGDIATGGIITFEGAGSLLLGVTMLAVASVATYKRIQDKRGDEDD
jgi:hypothetical protein